MNVKEYVVENKWYILLAVTGLFLIYYNILWEMVLDWDRSQDNSHGFIIPFVTAWFLYKDWDKIREIPVQTSRVGLLVILAGFVQLILGFLATEYMNMRVSFVVILAGMIIYIFGGNVFRRVRIPVAYLLFMVPIPVLIYNAVAFPLKLLVSKVSVATLKLIGIPVVREGNILMFPNVTLEVADACSGLRSLVSLLALSVALALLVVKSTWGRLVVIFMSIPVAVITNMIRVIVTGFLAKHFGGEVAQGFFHEFAGIVVFVLALALLTLIAVLVRKVEVRYEK